MSKTKIEWAQHTLNPYAGCTRVDEGCRRCYAERMAARLQAMARKGKKSVAHYDGLVDDNGRWTGAIGFNWAVMDAMLRRRTPTLYFVNSMTDVWHKGVPDESVDRLFQYMIEARQHRFMILTKREARMEQYMAKNFSGAIPPTTGVPLPIRGTAPDNVAIGVSAHDQPSFEKRVVRLLGAPARWRFLSLEPQLGPITTRGIILAGALDLVIAGGETQPGARPPHPGWFTQLRDECEDLDLAFMFKQFGVWAPHDHGKNADGKRHEMRFVRWNGESMSADDAKKLRESFMDDHQTAVKMWRVGKKRAGRTLEGKTHDANPFALAA